MTARTHDAIALASLITVAAYYPPETLTAATVFVSLIAVVIGALLPDMDQASNRLWDLLPMGDTFSPYLRSIFNRHRTLSHSLLGGTLIYYLLTWLLPKILNTQFIDPQIVLYSVMIGFTSHLLADSATKDGLPLFFPLKLKIGIPPVSALRITTDSWVEKFLVFPGVIYYMFWFINNHREHLLHLIRIIK